MPLEKRFIHGHILQARDLLSSFKVEHSVQHNKGIPMGQKIKDSLDIQRVYVVSHGYMLEKKLHRQPRKKDKDTFLECSVFIPWGKWKREGFVLYAVKMEGYTFKLPCFFYILVQNGTF